MAPMCKILPLVAGAALPHATSHFRMSDPRLADDPSDRPVGIAKSRQYFPEAESLRGIACLLVFFHHLLAGIKNVGGDGGYSPPLWASIILGGHTGVSLFFILSSFLLTQPFLIEITGGKRVSRREFFSRRVLRILPLYYVAVTVGTDVMATQAHDLLKGIPYLFFLNSFAGWSESLAPYSAVWWSLATEAQFYVALPLAVVILR